MLAVGTRIKNPWPTCRNEVPGRYQREFGTFRNIDNTDGSSATVEIGTPVQGITMQPYGDWGFRSAPFSTPGVVRTLVVSPAIYNPTCKWIDTHQLPYPSTSPTPQLRTIRGDLTAGQCWMDGTTRRKREMIRKAVRKAVPYGSQETRCNRKSAGVGIQRMVAVRIMRTS